MAFGEFFSAIEAPALRAIAGHWEQARGAKRMPGWKDINPITLAPYLSIVWAWKYDRASDAFTGRLAGEEIAAIFQKSFRGAAMKTFFQDWDYGTIFARHKRVVAEPAFMRGVGMVFSHAAKYGIGERIILPLAEDGETGDGILGATTYGLRPSSDGGRGPVEAREEIEFFALD